MAFYTGQPVRSALNYCKRHETIDRKTLHSSIKYSDHVNVAPSKKFTTFEIKKCEETLSNPYYYLNAFPVIYENVIKTYADPGGGFIQVRDYHLHCKQTGEKLYIICKKKEDLAWKMTHVSYTATDIIGILHISIADLPRASIKCSALRKIQRAKAQIKFSLADVKQRTAWIKSKRTPWNKIPIYNKTTIYGMNLILSKEQFVSALEQFANKMDEENVELVPIIRCKDDVFHVQMAWIVDIAVNRNIALALELNECKLMIRGIYLDINDVHKLAHADRSCKCLSNFKCDIDRLQIGESEAIRASQSKLAKKTNEYNQLRKQYDAELQRLESTCARLEYDSQCTQTLLKSLLQEQDSLRTQQHIFQLVQYRRQIQMHNKQLLDTNNQLQL